MLLKVEPPALYLFVVGTVASASREATGIAELFLCVHRHVCARVCVLATACLVCS